MKRNLRSILLAVALFLAFGSASATSPPWPPTQLGVLVNTANLYWTPTQSPGTVTYNVYRSLWIVGQPDSFTQVSNGLSGTTFSDAGARSYYPYHYFVTAVIGGVESGPSNTILVYPTF
jgi:hypothetical protein